jgi:hypothetical protein
MCEVVNTYLCGYHTKNRAGCSGRDPASTHFLLESLTGDRLPTMQFMLNVETLMIDR